MQLETERRLHKEKLAKEKEKAEKMRQRLLAEHEESPLKIEALENQVVLAKLPLWLLCSICGVSPPRK